MNSNLLFAMITVSMSDILTGLFPVTPYCPFSNYHYALITLFSQICRSDNYLTWGEVLREPRMPMHTLRTKCLLQRRQ